ncbi:hypothetical protein [Streptomyces nigrescens]|uniref:hypothetical protein n=1 Tax=Streptomyces nigrescens TaxID=1920 RepID=UPI0034831EDE
MPGTGRRDGAAAERRDGGTTRSAPRSGHVSGVPYVLLMADVPSRVQGKILLKN